MKIALKSGGNVLIVILGSFLAGMGFGIAILAVVYYLQKGG